MGIALPIGAAERFLKYDEALRRENARQNLTRDLYEPDYIERLYLDSLAPLAVPGLIPERARVADVGSGAGLPGIPLSIARPDISVTLIEAIGKRAAFLQETARTIGGWQVSNTRAEDFAREHRGQFDVVVCRAVAPLAVLIEYAAPLLSAGGILAAYKGPGAAGEVREAGRAADEVGAAWHGIIPIKVPGTDWNHTLAIAEQIRECPAKYPRRAGAAEKKPLYP